MYVQQPVQGQQQQQQVMYVQQPQEGMGMQQQPVIMMPVQQSAPGQQVMYIQQPIQGQQMAMAQPQPVVYQQAPPQVQQQVPVQIPPQQQSASQVTTPDIPTPPILIACFVRCIFSRKAVRDHWRNKSPCFAGWPVACAVFGIIFTIGAIVMSTTPTAKIGNIIFFWSIAFILDILAVLLIWALCWFVYILFLFSFSFLFLYINVTISI